MPTVVVQGPQLTPALAREIAGKLGGRSNSRSSYHNIVTADAVSLRQLNELRAAYPVDINLLPDTFDPARVKLLVTDMDSTFINIECVDEIADFLGIKPQVAKITEAAMRGELDFEGSLTQRVSLLKGLDTSALEHVYNERLQINPGGEAMLAALKQNGIRIALVSGGFTFFTERLKQRYQLDYTLANVLEIENDRLTGKVAGSIVGAKPKADFLLAKCKEMKVAADQAVAMGDGANDLTMMKQAGLSIAYHAKPRVQAEASTALNHCGLEGVIGLLQL
jgi:phosphoserine phosphatase